MHDANEGITRYPLSWPAGWQRTTGRRARAKFGRGETKTVTSGTSSWTHRQTKALTAAQAIDRLRLELGRLGARAVVLSTNLAVRLDGWPRSGQGEPDDPGAAVYFTLHGHDRCLACDRWDRVADNIAAIAAHVAALRGIDRWGVGTMDQAFTGYAALPPTADEWWLVLGIGPQATIEQVERTYRDRARLLHPDVEGGDHDRMVRLNAAREAARKALGS